MIWPDAINGSFEILGGGIVCLNIRQVLKDRRVAGVHWGPFIFFAAWGLWNLFYYPHLGQWMSFIGGFGVTLANLTYAWLLIYYGKRPGGRQ